MSRVRGLSSYKTESEELMYDYFIWLCEIISIDDLDYNHYKILMKQLHTKEFYWTVPNDDNRSLDGKMMRDKFADCSTYTNFDAIDGPCTILEMLVALAIRCDDDVMYDPDKGNRPQKWFWIMLKNLGLSRCIDKDCGQFWVIDDVNHVLDKVLDRQYKENGVGGFFPLKIYKDDQRHVEIWYQMNAYLLENYDID